MAVNDRTIGGVMPYLEERQRTSSAWVRAGGGAGIAFAVLFVAGLLKENLPDSDATDGVVAGFYADAGNRSAEILSLYLLALAGVCFLWFLGSLYGTLRRAEGEQGPLAGVALGGGVIFVALLFAANSAFGAVAGAMAFGSMPQPSAELTRLLPQLGFGLLLIHGMFAAIALVVATSVLILRTGVFPRWSAWLGFPVAVILLGGVIFLPMLAFPLWVLLVGILLLIGG